MSQLETFLTSLSDSELAIFVAYRFDGFMSSSREKIIREIQRRELNRDKLTALYKEGLPVPDEPGYHCPQCNSDRFFVEQDHEMRSRRYASYEVIIETKRCRLCGYNPDKRKPKNLWDAIRLKFTSKGRTRLAHPSEMVFRDFL